MPCKTPDFTTDLMSTTGVGAVTGDDWGLEMLRSGAMAARFVPGFGTGPGFGARRTTGTAGPA